MDADIANKWGEYNSTGDYAIEYSDSGEYYIPPDEYWSSGWPDGWSSPIVEEESMIERQLTVGQLTVGQLKQLLADMPDDVEVWIKLPEHYESKQDSEWDSEGLTSSLTSVDSNLIEYYRITYAEDEGWPPIYRCYYCRY